jgi:putative addiction module component (TIGR02574 family)
MAQITVEEIHDLALKLGLDDRAKLAAELIASLGPGPLEKDEGYDEAWAAEIERRLVEIEEGRVATRSAEEVFAEMRQLLDDIHANNSTNQNTC